MKRRLLWLAGGMTLLFLGITVASLFASPSTLSLQTVTLRPPEGEVLSLDVEWAVTPDEQARGLMFRPHVRRGMFFLFEAEEPRAFWMKNTLVPLDIIFFNADRTYVSATTMQPCGEDPCPQYVSDAPAKYALEMPAGFVQERGIGKDWKIAW